MTFLSVNSMVWAASPEGLKHCNTHICYYLWKWTLPSSSSTEFFFSKILWNSILVFAGWTETTVCACVFVCRQQTCVSSDLPPAVSFLASCDCDAVWLLQKSRLQRETQGVLRSSHAPLGLGEGLSSGHRTTNDSRLLARASHEFVLPQLKMPSFQNETRPIWSQAQSGQRTSTTGRGSTLQNLLESLPEAVIQKGIEEGVEAAVGIA